MRIVQGKVGRGLVIVENALQPAIVAVAEPGASYNGFSRGGDDV